MPFTRRTHWKGRILSQRQERAADLYDYLRRSASLPPRGAQPEARKLLGQEYSGTHFQEKCDGPDAVTPSPPDPPHRGSASEHGDQSTTVGCRGVRPHSG